MIDSLLQDFRFAARLVRNNPGFSAVLILCLALGIGPSAAAFSLINASLLRPVDVEGHVAEKDLLAYVTKLGPVGVALRDVQDEALRARVTDALGTAFQPYIRDGAAHSHAAPGHP